MSRVVNRNTRRCSHLLACELVLPERVLSVKRLHQLSLPFHQQEGTSGEHAPGFRASPGLSLCPVLSPVSLFEGRKPDCANPAEANVEESEPALLLKPGDIVLKEPGSSEKTLRTLLRPGDQVSNHYKTTSSEICAVVGAVPPACYPTDGVPTVRSDLPAPLIRRVSDRTSYGEEGNAYSLLHPTIFAQKGVFERDFFKTRSKQEISEILCNIGVKLSEDEFENVWNLASKKHHRGEVCVENIRNVLDELQHADRAKCKAAT